MGTIKRNFLYNLLLTVSNIIFPIITFPYASRILGPEGIGKVQFVTTFAMYFVLLAALGIPVYGIREIAKHRSQPGDLKRIFTELLSINLVTSLMMLLIYTGVVLLSPTLFIDLNFYTVAAFMLIFSCCNIDWLFSGLEQFRFIAFRSVLVKAISLICLFFLVKYKTDDIYYLGITVAGTVLNNLWNIWSARHYIDFKTLAKENLKKHIKPLLFIFSTIAAISVYVFLDTIILGFLVDYEAVGYYTAASRINKITIPVLTSLGTVMIPQIAHAFKEENLEQVKALARHSLEFVILLGIPMTIGLIVLAPELIRLFAGPEFSEAILPMQLFAPVVLIIGLSNIWSVQILMPAAMDKHVTIAVVYGLIASLILNFSLIPHFSYIGATIANVLSEMVVMAGLIYYSSKIIKINFDFKLSFQTLAISLLFLPVVMGFRALFEHRDLLVCMFTVLSCGVIYALLQITVVRNKLILGQLEILKQKFISR